VTVDILLSLFSSILFSTTASSREAEKRNASSLAQINLGLVATTGLLGESAELGDSLSMLRLLPPAVGESTDSADSISLLPPADGEYTEVGDSMSMLRLLPLFPRKRSFQAWVKVSLLIECIRGRSPLTVFLLARIVGVE